MRLPRILLTILVMTLGMAGIACASDSAQDNGPTFRKVEIPFQSHDGHEMFGVLTLPVTSQPRGLVIYVQTAEGATVDMKRMKSREATFNYYDLYREKLGALNIAFFSYEGRGIRMGDKPPRFEKIDWDVYNTSTLDNKVRDAISAVETVRKQPGLGKTRILLMGASESTLLAAETASRIPKQIAGLVLYGVLATNMRENFRYIMSDGAFLPVRTTFDKNGDGKISRAEYEENPKKTTPFDKLDVDGDGFFTVEDLIALKTKPYLDAIENEDYAVLQNWAKTSAAVSVPDNWFKDHFAHKPIWSFLSNLDIPIGCFHGALDNNTPIAGVQRLEEAAKKAGKTKMKFYYFSDLEHTLRIGSYFVRGELPAGHQAIFAFIKDQFVND